MADATLEEAAICASKTAEVEQDKDTSGMVTQGVGEDINHFNAYGHLKGHITDVYGDRHNVEYNYRDWGMLTLEELVRISYVPKFVGVDYHFVKIFWYKEGDQSFNTTVVRVLGNKIVLI